MEGFDSPQLRERRLFTDAGAPVYYRPAIDGLRAVAVLAVFVFHLDHRWMPGGFVGVDIFFVISGFLITSILLREHERESFSLTKFYQRRIARLFPAYFTMSLATLCGSAVIYSDQDFASAGANLMAATLSVANFKLLMQGNYFKVSGDAQPFLHCWSLSVEEQFYLLFPSLLLAVHLWARPWKTKSLITLFLASLIGCVAMTGRKPEWAFYMLPTRAWELLAGSILAVFSKRAAAPWMKLERHISWIGLVLVLISLRVIHESSSFPGYLATLPVAGTALALGLQPNPNSWAERLLSWAPFVRVGQMSYSLYLWHWPVFSLVDYGFYKAPFLARLVLKIGVSTAGAVLCFYLVERPARLFLNEPKRRKATFAFVCCAMMIFVPLGVIVRRANYIDANPGDVASGGLEFNSRGKNGSIVLIGDSHGSMYGKITKEIASELDMKLNVLSVAAADPLPVSTGIQSKLWEDSLSFVKREKPDVLILACEWQGKLKTDRERAKIAVAELKKYAGKIIIITQPPILPRTANRESIRAGIQGPFFEDFTNSESRREYNNIISEIQAPGVIILDTDPIFRKPNGEIRVTSEDGQELYHDRSHLSGAGAKLLKKKVMIELR